MEGDHPTAMVSPSMVAPGALLAGKYRVERVLGEGGMGIVVAAHHVALDQRVALKLLRGATMDRPDVVERFVREARNAVRLRSNHVARVFDVGTLDNGWPYIVLEYLEGADIDHMIRHHGPFAIERAVSLILQACEAVAEAHALGIVHRDLKPHNLFLTTGFGGSDLLKVLDFGIAKSTSMQGVLTRSDSSVGSPLYMSPEQMRTPRDVDARTDIWSLGVTLYEMIAGRPPFDAESFPELVLKVTEGKWEPLSLVRRDVPAALSDVIGKCIQREPEMRFETVADLATALEPFAAPESRQPAENARRALGRKGTSSSQSRLPPATKAPESPAPSTLKETDIATARTPDVGANLESANVPSVPSIPFELRPVTGSSNTSGPTAWSESASTDIVIPRKSPLLALALGSLVALLVGMGFVAYLRMRPAGTAEVSSPASAGVSSTRAPSVEPAKTLEVAGAAIAPSEVPAPPAASSSARTRRTKPSSPGSNAASPVAAPPKTVAQPKPVDEIPAER